MRIASTQLWVHDQDGALAFYRDKLGMEVRQDVSVPEMGNFRWLTVSPQGQPEIVIVLMKIMGPPLMDARTSQQVAELMSLGCAGTVFLTTDDRQRTHEELAARGVEFTETPERRLDGIDAAFRDPSGNSFRITQIDTSFAEPRLRAQGTPAGRGPGAGPARRVPLRRGACAPGLPRTLPTNAGPTSTMPRTRICMEGISRAILVRRRGQSRPMTTTHAGCRARYA